MTSDAEKRAAGVTEAQRQAIQSFVHSAIVPLIEDVIVKKLGQAAIVLRDELQPRALTEPREDAVERVARAIYANEWAPGSPAWAGLRDVNRIAWRNMARAAIAAMQESTK